MGYSTFDKIEVRIKHITENLPEYHDQLIFSLEYIDKDPQSSLTKSRIVLEKTLNRIYQLHFDKEPKKLEIGFILNDNQFTRLIDRRILSRMNSVRDMANLGAHGEEVQPTDAKRVLDDLCEILNWFIQDHLKKEEKAKTQKADNKAQKQNKKTDYHQIEEILNSASDDFNKGDFKNAAGKADEALRLLNESGGKKSFYHAAALNIIGCSLMNEKEFTPALENFSVCMDILKGLPKNDAEYRVICNNAVIASLCCNQTGKVLDLIEKYFEAGDNPPDNTESRTLVQIKNKLS